MSIELEHYTHASLYVDLDCTGCKKLIGLPNVVKWQDKYYYERCLPESYRQEVDKLID